MNAKVIEMERRRRIAVERPIPEDAGGGNFNDLRLTWLPISAAAEQATAGHGAEQQSSSKASSSSGHSSNRKSSAAVQCSEDRNQTDHIWNYAGILNKILREPEKRILSH